ncbi:MAG: hypothetical protein AAFP86_06855, partial [Planctomycetota bacterium]
MEGNRTNRAEAPRSVPSASVRSAPLAWLAAVFLAAPAAAGSVPGPARNDPPAGASTPDPSEPAKTDADRRARIAALSVELFDLGPDQLAERAEFHRAQERAPELVADDGRIFRLPEAAVDTDGSELPWLKMMNRPVTVRGRPVRRALGA